MMGNIWKTENLTSVLFLIESGKRPRGGVSEDLGPIPSLGGENLTQDGNLDFSSVKTIPESFYDSLTKSKLEYGDVLINKDGAQTGKVGIYRGEFDKAAINEHLFRMRGKDDKITQQYLFYFLLWEETQQKIARVTTGSAQPGINSSFPKYISISYPKLSLQREITKILNSLDDLINFKNDVVEKLGQVKQGLLHDLLIHGVNENGNLRNPETSPELFNNFKGKQIPISWKVVKFSELLKVLYRYPSYYGIDYQTKGVPEVRGELILENGNLSKDKKNYRYISKRTAEEFPKVHLEKDDFVMSVRGTLGKIGIVPSWLKGSVITANLIRMKFDKTRVHPGWMKNYLLSKGFQRALDKRSSATTIKTIQTNEIENINVALPPLQEQKIISGILAKQDKLLEEKLNYLRKTEKIKKGLMDDLLTGKVRIDK